MPEYALFASDMPGHYVKIWHKPQNQKYTRYCIVVKGGLNHIHSYCNMYRKLCEVWTCAFLSIAHRHMHRDMLISHLQGKRWTVGCFFSLTSVNEITTYINKTLTLHTNLFVLQVIWVLTVVFLYPVFNYKVQKNLLCTCTIRVRHSGTNKHSLIAVMFLLWYPVTTATYTSIHHIQQQWLIKTDQLWVLKVWQAKQRQTCDKKRDTH